VKAVVTGGAGFIGSHLVDRLLAEGLEVVAVDNLATGRRENLAQASASPNFTLHAADVADFSAIQPAFADADWVFHLAGLADIVPSIQKPLHYHQANVDGTVNVLEAARLAGAKRVVYAASSSCYGLPDELPTPESAAIRTMYPYALSKYVGEEYLLHWSRTYRLPCVSLRLFNVYGPRSRTTGAYGAVFGVFLAQRLAGKPYTVVGDGAQTRDFVFVSDVVDAFVRAARSDASGAVFNVGAGAPQSVNRLVELLGGPKTHIPKRPGEPDCSWADIRAITAALGWKPQVSFEQGVRIMLEHISLWQDAPVWTPESIGEATKAWFAFLGK
jgi:UDP-glucose 4-epimerase